MAIDWRQYRCENFYDELCEAPGRPRAAALKLAEYLGSLSEPEMAERRLAAELAIKVMGISFTVYSEGKNVDRAWPFDIIPRIIPLSEWVKTEAGLKQRAYALNLFIQDLYNDQKIIKDGVFPADLLNESVNFRKQCVGVKPANGVWAHICGSDLVRDKDGTMYVLEDNLRVPSGVSYMVENRLVTKRVFPELFEATTILPVDDYPAQLYDTLAAISPRPLDQPNVVLLTPGIFNSAYFEHAYLAQQMGIELVEGTDLFVADDDCVYMRTIYGPRRVDVIYRRIDDLFLDPEAFNPESILGVPGLMRAWISGRVALANCPGAGVADDKVVYAFVPAMIKYYLGEDPIIPNVPSFLCMDPKQREYVIANLDKLVVKPANESGGYGMLIGPRSTAEEREKFRRLIEANPRNYMAQPTLALSTAPTMMEDNTVEPRHLDLRPFILSRGSVESTYVTTGGLTRVAMIRGSLVVNSSQGGGAKDTWIVDMDEAPTQSQSMGSMTQSQTLDGATPQDIAARGDD
ncbi:MAG: circularly permuted type 2 ATP-grasp protein [Hydrocarboniphaga sp.]|nr:circularly permuted type 2 ATP-grasp protein [Hydrocarboniphaga sp.]MDB5971909.1 circularly permuted type 2 ATP-grasp protein [Hydrocarboniphaga sp.]